MSGSMFGGMGYGGSGIDQMMLMNPVYGAAARQAAYGQALMQQASDISPVRSPLQSAARAIQGLLGGYEMGNAQTQFQTINAQMQQQAQAALNAAMGITGAGGPGAGGGSVATPPPAAGAGSVANAMAPPSPAVTSYLTSRESGGNAGITNPQGFTGTYQVGTGILNDAGLYTPAPGEDLSKNQWTGTLNIPGFSDVKTQADFLKNPDAQKAAFNAAWQMRDSQLARMGAYDHLGQSINGIPITKDGLLAGAWLGGPGGVLDFLNGRSDPADANGTHVSDYVLGASAATQPQTQVAGQGVPSPGPGASLPPITLPNYGVAGAGRTGGGAAVGAPVPGAPAGSTPGAANINNMPSGVQRALQLRTMAMQYAISPNPYLRGLSAQMNQEAQMLMQQGIYSEPTALGDGRYVTRNLFNNKVEILGSQDRLYTNAQGDLVNPQGAIISHSPGYSLIQNYGNGTMLVQDPKGEPKYVTTGLRPDSEAQFIISRVQQLKAANQPIPPALQSAFPGAYQQLYGPQTKVDDQGRAVTITPKPPPAGTPSPEEVIGGGAAPPAPAAPAMPTQAPAGFGAAGGNVAPPAPTTTATTTPPPTTTTTGGVSVQPLPGLTPQQAKAGWDMVQSQFKDDQTQVGAVNASAAAGRPMLGTSNVIRGLLQKAQTGWGFEERLAAAQALNAAGASGPAVDRMLNMNVPAGEELQKQLFQITTGAVRNMGAREPGSVINLFMNRYPSPESRPETINAMTRIMDMQQQYNDDRAAAMSQWVQQQRALMDTPGAKPGDYQSLSQFNTQFNATHDPRAYAAAGLAASGVPSAEWSQGLSGPQMKQARDLAYSMYPGIGLNLPGAGGKDQTYYRPPPQGQ